MRRKESASGRPVASICDQPVILSAAGLRNEMFPALSVQITASPIESSVIWKRICFIDQILFQNLAGHRIAHGAHKFVRFNLALHQIVLYGTLHGIHRHTGAGIRDIGSLSSDPALETLGGWETAYVRKSRRLKALRGTGNCGNCLRMSLYIDSTGALASLTGQFSTQCGTNCSVYKPTNGSFSASRIYSSTTCDEAYLQGSWIPRSQSRRCGFQLIPLARFALVLACYRSCIGSR